MHHNLTKATQITLQNYLKYGTFFQQQQKTKNKKTKKRERRIRRKERTEKEKSKLVSPDFAMLQQQNFHSFRLNPGGTIRI